MNMKEESNFFDWFVNIFKKPKPIQLSEEEIAKQKKEKEIKARYSLEYLESYDAYFVKFYFQNNWWYLRRWDEDYTLERVRGNAIRIRNKEDLDRIIYLHQDWISEGHIHLNFD